MNTSRIERLAALDDDPKARQNTYLNTPTNRVGSGGYVWLMSTINAPLDLIAARYAEQKKLSTSRQPG